MSASGSSPGRSAQACRRQRDDMVLLAHGHEAFTLSNGTYGSPRMVQELRDNGLTIGRRRVARLMRENRLGLGEAAVQAHHRQPSRLSDRPEPSGPGLRSGRAEPEVGRRHLLRVDPRGLALPRRRHRPVRPARRRLGNQRSASQGTGIVGSAPGHRRAASGRPPHSPRGPRQPILLPQLPRLS